MDKSAKTYRLSQNTLNYIESYAKQENITNTAALERIIQEHASICQEQSEQIANSVVKKIEEKYANMFTRIRLATTMTDRHTDVILEILNTILITYKINNAYTSDMAQSNVWQECEASVKTKIEKYKQYKDNRGKK